MSCSIQVNDKQQVLDAISQQIDSGLPVHVEIAKSDEIYVVAFIKPNEDLGSSDDQDLETEEDLEPTEDEEGEQEEDPQV